MAFGHMLTIQNKGVVLYNKCLFAQCMIRLVIDYKMEGCEGHVKCSIECILMEVVRLSMEYRSQIKGNRCVTIHSQRPFMLRKVSQVAVSTRCHLAYTHTLLGHTSLTQFSVDFLLHSTSLPLNRIFPLQWKSDNDLCISVCTFTSYPLISTRGLPFV